MIRKERLALDRAREMSRREAEVARREADRLQSLREELRSLRSTANDTEGRKRNRLLPTKELLARTNAKKRARRTSTKLSFDNVLRESSICPTETSNSSRHTLCEDSLNQTGKVNTTQS